MTTDLQHLEQAPLTSQPLERFAAVADPERMQALAENARRLREGLAGQVLWNINSTAAGGGVAEMLRPLLGYARGAGIDARWMVISGTPEFFHVTKRLHHALHGSEGDGTELDAKARRIYEDTLHENAVELQVLVAAGDVVILHDPQTAGLAPYLMEIGADVIWRCHVGHDRSNAEVEQAWQFLTPYLSKVPRHIFSRPAYIPDYLDHGKSTIIQPCIDAFSTKNQEMDEVTMRAILVHTGLVEGPYPEYGDRHFLRVDGSPGRVERGADIIRHGRATSWDTPLVTQVSRWDSLKDPVGVIQGFSRYVENHPHGVAELLLAGPNVHAVVDAPEGAAVFREVELAWHHLPHAVRNRVHLASLPMRDIDENAAIVNALQRHSTIIVQKSLHEGFGLTVTEAMWKGRPVIASAVGGIQDQIEDGVHGLLLRQPQDLDAFAAALERLLDDPELARNMGAAARERARVQFLGIRSLLQFADLLLETLQARTPDSHAPVIPPL